MRPGAIESDRENAFPRVPRDCRALVAEDDASMREMVVGLLEMDGYEVVETTSGEEMLKVLQEEAIASFPEESFDIIVTDVRMPGASGLEIVSRLRSLGCATPVIVMTAFPEESLRMAVEGLDSLLLAKPFALDALRAAAHFYTSLGARYARCEP